MSATIDRLLQKTVDGVRLTREEGEALMGCRDLHKLGRAAHAVTMRLHPEPYRTYNIDRNINYTNVCTFRCKFCAFSKGPLSLNLRGKPYLIELEEMQRRLTALGLYGDKLDGKAGMKTRLALGAYQKANKLALDCWPTAAVLERMRAAKR